MYHEKDLAAIKTKYSSKTVVVKYGGNAMTGKNAAISLMDNIVLLQSLGVQIVLVHGGGPEINAMLKKAGNRKSFCERASLYRQRKHSHCADGACGQSE